MAEYAVVTGASRGVGRAIATHLSRRGFGVVLTARGSDRLLSVIAELAEGRHLAVPADLGVAADRERLIADVARHVGDDGLTAFVHCASATPDPDVESLLATTSVEQVQEHVDVTGLAGARLLMELKDLLAKPRRSSAVLMSSDWVLPGAEGPPIFSAAKAFATQVWRSSRREYLQEGIVLSSIVAGDIASFDEAWEDPKWSLDHSIDDVRSELGQSRIALSDVVRAVDLVLSAELAAVTEIQILPLDPEYSG